MGVSQDFVSTFPEGLCEQGKLLKSFYNIGKKYLDRMFLHHSSLSSTIRSVILLLPGILLKKASRQ